MSDQLAERRKPVRIGDWEIPFRPHGKRKQRGKSTGAHAWNTHLGDAGGFRWSVTTFEDPGSKPFRFAQGWVRLDCGHCGRKWQSVVCGSTGLGYDFRNLIAAYLNGGCGGCGTRDHDKRGCEMGNGFEGDQKWCPECCHDFDNPDGVPWGKP